MIQTWTLPVRSLVNAILRPSAAPAGSSLSPVLVIAVPPVRSPGFLTTIWPFREKAILPFRPVKAAEAGPAMAPVSARAAAPVRTILALRNAGPGGRDERFAVAELGAPGALRQRAGSLDERDHEAGGRLAVDRDRAAGARAKPAHGEPLARLRPGREPEVREDDRP